MARPRKNPVTSFAAPSANLTSWADTLGEALGRGIARGINAGLSTSGFGSFGAVNAAPTQPLARRRGRPPKAQLAGGAVPADRRCKVEGCGREARSKGLCSAHYQAERRRLLTKAGA